MQPLLREIFAEARRESVEALKLKDAAVRDEAFLQAALAKLEAYAKRKFNYFLSGNYQGNLCR